MGAYVMTVDILVLNAGSSTLKYALFEVEDGKVDPAPRLKGITERQAGLSASAQDQATIAAILEACTTARGRRPAAVGHRVVHGGRGRGAPAVVDADLMRELEALVPLVPLHQPHNLAGIRAVATIAPDLPQVAAFDTAFHRSIPEITRRFAIPAALHAAGLERYGFHGLSYQSATELLGAGQPGGPRRLVVLHLGSGASAAAILDGRSRATTMGFSALDGLVMATRPGEMDPGALLHLIEAHGHDAKSLTKLLYKDSGLLGLSGESEDMRVLLASPRPEAKLAIAVYVERAARTVASLAVTLGGLDMIAFTGGVGENSAPIRAAILDQLAFLGVDIDAAKNTTNAARFEATGAPIALAVVPAEEERVIAAATVALIG